MVSLARHANPTASQVRNSGFQEDPWDEFSEWLGSWCEGQWVPHLAHRNPPAHIAPVPGTSRSPCPHCPCPWQTSVPLFASPCYTYLLVEVTYSYLHCPQGMLDWSTFPLLLQLMNAALLKYHLIFTLDCGKIICIFSISFIQERLC